MEETKTISQQVKVDRMISKTGKNYNAFVYLQDTNIDSKYQRTLHMPKDLTKRMATPSGSTLTILNTNSLHNAMCFRTKASLKNVGYH